MSEMTQTLRVREYYYMILRHKLAFWLVMLASVAISVTLTYTLPKIYRAETVLMVEDERVLNPLISGLAIAPSIGSRMMTMKDELFSWQRLTLLSEKLGLDKRVKTPRDYEKLILGLRKNLQIQMKPNGLIIISFEGQSPKKAQSIVQTLAEIIVEGNLTSTKVETSGAIRFIDDQLSEYRKKLEASEAKLRQFEEVYNATLPLATRMNEHIVALKIELGRLMIENTEDHPRVIQTKKLIKQVELQRDEQMRKAREKGFDIPAQNYAELISSVPLQRQHLEKLQRDYNVNENIYLSLLKRLETAKISQTLENSDKGTKFRVLEPARMPIDPVKPNKVLIIVAGVLIGLGLGMGTIYVLELSNTSVRSIEEARDLFELPIYGAIPMIRPEQFEEAERVEDMQRVGL